MVDFLVIGPYVSILYVDIFPLVKYGRIYTGYNRSGMYFNDMHINSCWFQNIIDFDTDLLLLNKCYSDNYRKFDNFDALYVEKIKDIPVDYDGLIGVPVTFIEKWNKRQFEIVGVFSDNKADGIDVFNGEERYIDEGHKHFTGPVVDGKALMKRILIRKR